jgi:hypothetical protein
MVYENSACALKPSEIERNKLNTPTYSTVSTPGAHAAPCIALRVESYIQLRMVIEVSLFTIVLL